MIEVAVFQAGELLRLERGHEKVPPDIPHKEIAHYPVVRTKGPEPDFEGLRDGDYVLHRHVPPPRPGPISDRQFFQALAVVGRISEAEALAAVKTGDMPAELAAVVNAIPDKAARFSVTMHVCGAVTFERDHPLTVQLGAMIGMRPEEIDALWELAGKL